MEPDSLKPTDAQRQQRPPRFESPAGWPCPIPSIVAEKLLSDGPAVRLAPVVEAEQATEHLGKTALCSLAKASSPSSRAEALQVRKQSTSCSIETTSRTAGLISNVTRLLRS